MAEPYRLAYFVTLFPKLSEAFVLQEVVRLREAGVRALPVSFESSDRRESSFQASARPLLGEVVYTKDGAPWQQGRDLGFWLRRRPLAVLAMVWAACRRPVIRGHSRLGKVASSLTAARQVHAAGVRHIHAHWSYPTDIARLVSILTPVTLSCTLHAHDIFEDLPLYASRGEDAGRRLGLMKFVMTCTSHNQEVVSQLLAEPAAPPVRFAYHGLDVDELAVRPPGPPDAEGTRFISVGRMVPYKGFDVILEVFAEVLRERPRCTLVLAGSPGSLTARLTAVVADRGLGPAVTIIESPTRDEVLRLLGEADVFVNYSDPVGEYGVANVIVEALGTGLAVIATDRPHTREYLVDGVNAVVVPHGDPGRLRSAMSDLAADPARAAVLGKAGRHTVEESFDVDDATEQLVALFEPWLR